MKDENKYNDDANENDGEADNNDGEADIDDGITMTTMRELAILVCKKSLAALPGIAYCEGEEGRHFSTVDLSPILQHASRNALFVCQLLC